MPYLLRFVVLWWLMFGQVAVGRVVAQPLLTGFYSMEEGLSERTVRDVLIGPCGFLWLATSSGLNRFDGYEFITFNDSRSQSAARRLSFNDIAGLHLAEDKRIVLRYNQRSYLFDLFDPVTHLVESVDIAVHPQIEGQPRALHVDAAGKIFVITVQNGLAKLYLYQNQGFSHLFDLPDLYPRNATVNIQFFHLADGSFLVYDPAKGLRQINAQGKQQMEIDLASEQRTRPASLNIIIERQNKEVWLGFNGRTGIWKWQPGSSQLVSCTLVPAEVFYSNAWTDHHGNVILNQTDALGDFPRTIRLFCIRVNDHVVDFTGLLQEDGEYMLAATGEDFFRTIFCGMDTGLKTYRTSFSKIKNFLTEKLSNYQRGPVMRGFASDGEYVYVAREQLYWYRLDPATDVLDTIELYDQASGQKIDFNCSLDLQYDPAGYLWGIACEASAAEGGLLLRYDLATCNTTVFRYLYRFTCMEMDSSGRIWLGVAPPEEQGGLVYFDPHGDQVFHFFQSAKGSNPFKGAAPRYIKHTRDHSLWVGTLNGLVHLWPDSRQVQLFSRRQEEGKSLLPLSDNTIYVIHESTQGELLLGTKGGLDVYNPKTGKLRSFTERDGLASNTVCGILPDERGNYWISTYSGLSYYDVSKESFLRYYRADGFAHNEFNRFSFFQDHRGRYYFGGVNGFSTFYSKDLVYYLNTPPVLLTSLVRYNRWEDSLHVQAHDLQYLKTLVIHPSDDYFVLNFSLPDYTQPARNRYRYKLEGVDKDWVTLNSQHSLRYHNLKPGNYKLYLQGAGPNGFWGAEAKVLDIQVNRIFYKQAWFVLLWCGVAIYAIYWFFRYRLEQRLREERLRTKLASDLHDEVSGLLAGIAMQAELLMGTDADQQLRTRVSRISEASRRAMSKMSDVIWSIDSRRDKLSDLILRMQEHADEVLLPLNIKYEMTTEKLDREETIPANIRQDLYFIYKEAINNVAKHSQATLVKISLANLLQHFELRIEDNGIGHTQLNGAQRRGQGLSNLSMRAQRLHAELVIDTGQGYRIQLRMKRFM